MSEPSSYHTSDVYLIFENERTGNFAIVESAEYAVNGPPIDPDTEGQFSFLGWSTDPRPATPNTSGMYLVFADEAGEHHRQPWSDALMGPPVDDNTHEVMDLVGWIAPG